MHIHLHVTNNSYTYDIQNSMSRYRAHAVLISVSSKLLTFWKSCPGLELKRSVVKSTMIVVDPAIAQYKKGVRWKSRLHGHHKPKLIIVFGIF